MKTLPPRAAAVLALTVLLAADGCAGSGRPSSAAGQAVAAAPDACNDTGLLRDRALPPPVADEVTVCGTVAGVRAPRRTRSGLHQYFFVTVHGARPVEVVANLDQMGGPLPLRGGQNALVHGRYYKDPDGHEGIDWTHRGTSRRWPYAGYVVLDGRTYR